MADRDYIVDVILQARDDTARAFASATGQLEAYDKLLDEQKTKNEAARVSQSKYVQELDKGTNSLSKYKTALASLGLSLDQNKKKTDDQNKSAQRTIDALVSLEGAQRKATQAQVAGKENTADYAKALNDVRNAQLELGRSLRDSQQLSVQASTARAHQIQQEFQYQTRLEETAKIQKKNAQEQIQTQRQVQSTVDALNKETENARRDSMARLAQWDKQDAAERSARRKAESAEVAKDQKEQLDRANEFQRLTSRAQGPAQALARTDTGQRQEIQATRELATVRQLLVQRGFDEKLIDEELHGIRTEALHDFGHLDQASRDSARVQRDYADALKIVADAHRQVAVAQKSRTVTQVPARTAQIASTNVALDTIGFGGGGGGGGGAGGGLGDAAKSASSLGDGLGSAATKLLGFAAAAEPLSALLVGLVGTMGALASSALAAGSAVGVTFVSGIAQGIPALGLFAAAMQRLQGVFSLVSTIQGQVQQKFTAGFETAQQNAMGINQVAIAQHGLSDAMFSEQQSVLNVTAAEHGRSNALYALGIAEKNVNIAELSLSETRLQATRQLQDLVTQETNARLAAEASSLAVTNSQKALREAISTGGDVQGAQLQLSQAQAGHAQAVTQAQRSIQDASKGSLARQDIQQQVAQGQQAVTQARRAVTDAQFAYQQASQGVVAAQRAEVDAQYQVAQAKAAVTQAELAAKGYNLATAAQLAYLRATMSQTEQQLAGNITRILGLFVTIPGHIAKFRPLTDAILRPFTTLTDDIFKILTNPKIFGPLTTLANAIGKGLGSIMKTVFDPKSVGAFGAIIKDAANNVGPVASIISDVFKGIQAVVVAAGPFIADLFKYMASFAGQFDKFATSTKGQNFLKSFFTDGFNALKAFMGLGLALVKLFLTIAGPGGGAKTGTNLIIALTKALNGLTNDLNNKHSPAFKNLQKIWQSIGPALGALGEVFGALFKALFQLGTTKAGQDALKNIAQFIAQIVIPAFVTLAIWVGNAAGKIINFLKKHPELKSMLVDAVAAALALGLAGKLIGGLLGPISLVVDMVGKLHGLFKLIKDMDVGKVFSGIAEKAKGFAGGLKGFLTGGKVPKPGGAAAAGAEDVAGATTVGGTAVEGGAAAAVGDAAATAGGGAASFAGAVTGIGLVVGAIIALAKWTGTLKDLWNAIKAPFVAIWSAIQQPLQELGKQLGYMVSGFETLWNKIKEGAGVFGGVRTIIGDLLRPVFNILKDILGGVGKAIGDVLGGVIKIISGIFEIIGGLLHGDPGKVLDGAKKIGSGLLHAIIDPVKDIGTTIWNIIKDAFGGLVHLGGDIVNIGAHIGGKLVSGLVSAFKGLGGAILSVITDGINSGIIGPLDFLIKKINSIKIHIPKIDIGFIHIGGGTIGFSIPTIGLLGGGGGPKQASASDVAAAGFARGGPIPGFGGGDIIPARLEPGEHVLSKEEVSAAGGHGAIFAFRAGLGGGRQGGPFGYAAGGAAAVPSTALPTTQGTESVGPQLQKLLNVINQFAKIFQSNWSVMWTGIEKQDTDAITIIEKQFTDFFQNIEDQWAALNSKLTSSLNDWWNTTNQTAQSQLDKLLTSFDTTYTDVDTDSFNAFWYILHAAQVSLDAFGQKFTSPRLGAQPKMTKSAIGGFIGNMGQRGADSVMALLGNGEAVLNYAHQALVEPAMNATYGFGLSKMFQRTGGLHGMAGGGFAPTGRVVLDQGVNMGVGQEPQILTSLRELANELKETVYVISGYRTPGHSLRVGGFADDPHTRGQAADIGVGSPIRNTMFNVAEAALKAVGLYRPFYPGSNNEVNHVQLVAGGPSGAGVSGVASTIASATGAAWENIAKQTVRGSGALAHLMRASIGKVTDAANAFGMNAAGTSGITGVAGAGASPVNMTGNYANALKWTQQAMKIAGVTGPLWLKMLLRQEYNESTYNPNAINKTDINAQRGDPSRGILQTIMSTFMANALPGYNKNIYDPVSNIIAAIRYIIKQYGGGDPARGAETMWARGGGAYAGGGFIGNAIPILAHAGEWVVNQGQQSRLAGWLGTSVGGLKGAMGFTGGPRNFAGGGEISLQPTIGKTGAIQDPASLGGVEGLSFVNQSVTIVAQAESMLTRTIANLRKSGDKVNKALTAYLYNLGQLTGDGGILTLAAQALDDYSSNQTTYGSLAANGIRRITTTIYEKSSGLKGQFDHWGKAISKVTESLQKAKPETALQAATDELNRTQNVGDDLDRLQKQEVSALNSVGNQIENFGKVTKGNMKQYQRLIGQRKTLTDQIASTDSKIAQNAQDTIDQQQTQFQAQLNQTLRGTRTISGGDFRKAIGGSLNNLQGMIGKVGPAIALGIAQTAQTVAQTLGDPKKLQIADQAIITASTAQRDDLQQAYNKAAAKAKGDPRWQKVADDLLGQLESATTSLAQAQTQALTDAISTEDTKATHEAAVRSIQNRVAAVQTGFGNVAGGIATQISANRGTVSDLTGQIATYQALQNQAGQLGMTQEFQDLGDKIKDLTEQVSEASLQNLNLINALRQVNITLLQTQSQTATGLFGSASSIAQTIGSITGSLNLPALIKIANDSLTEITKEAGQAIQNVADTINDPNQPFAGNTGQANAFLGSASTAFQAGAATFGAWLSTNAGALAAFEATLPQPELTTFQGLIQALVDNTSANLNNTQTLQQLNATTGQQQFTSSAWTMFRQAIFNGLGQLLPQYAMTVPSLDVGGTLMSSGLLMGHAGEQLIPASVSRGNFAATNNQTNHFNIDHPVEVADPVLFGNQVAWRLAHDPNSR